MMSGPASPRLKVAVVTDSAASLSKSLAERFGIFVVPMELAFGARVYLDGYDLEPSQFYSMLKENPIPPTTSAPRPVRFLETFQQAAQKVESVLCLTIASQFTSSNSSAQLATEMAKESLSDVPIKVVDTATAAGGQALVVLEAARTAQQGLGLQEVTAAALKVVSRVRLFAFLDSLYYVWKSGRVPKIAHWAASILTLKPLLELSQGEVHMVERPRTRSRAMARLVDLTREEVGGRRVHAAVIHAAAPHEGEELRQRLAREFDCAELFVAEFTPVMGAHIGPGLLGIAFWTE